MRRHDAIEGLRLLHSQAVVLQRIIVKGPYGAMRANGLPAAAPEVRRASGATILSHSPEVIGVRQHRCVGDNGCDAIHRVVLEMPPSHVIDSVPLSEMHDASVHHVEAEFLADVNVPQNLHVLDFGIGLGIGRVVAQPDPGPHGGCEAQHDSHEAVPSRIWVVPTVPQREVHKHGASHECERQKRPRHVWPLVHQGEGRHRRTERKESPRHKQVDGQRHRVHVYPVASCEQRSRLLEPFEEHRIRREGFRMPGGLHRANLCGARAHCNLWRSVFLRRLSAGGSTLCGRAWRGASCPDTQSWRSTASASGPPTALLPCNHGSPTPATLCGDLNRKCP
mmetsp:Transcript_112721/g.318571  ORF Transcript_112721/g.318571 Transcript_112721/m.318571 type:complete len:336 (+) Transcript_112721:355-1362(+)